MNRRNFLAGMLAACAAPAIVRADSLMRIVPRETTIAMTPIAELTIGWEQQDFIVMSPTLQEIVTETFRRHAADIARNVAANNALLLRLAR